MPPKKGDSKKTQDKKATKVVEDKTFGLKNKNKSKSVQKYIAGVQNQVKGGVNKKTEAVAAEKKKKEKEEAERKKLEGELFKPTVQQTKVPLGVDPKSVVCEFFKKGLCTKGNKCKFSHNLEQGRKSDKIDIYTDRRTLDEKKPETGSEELDADGKPIIVSDADSGNKTKIVCKYFLEALETKKHGWFWECPNGGDKCMYMHSLPPGFVLKSKEEKDEDEEEITLEEQLEQERAKLTKRTPLTLETFLKWKEEKKSERVAQESEASKKREADIKSGKIMRSGREMFIFNPDLFVDDDDAIDTSELPEQMDEGPIMKIEVSGTSISTRDIKNENGETEEEGEENGEEDGQENEEKQIEESLFVEDEIPDEDLED
eukprot:TRINITY_DN15730_c0_g1_i1.p1 TRINITY_DN15730_c0_g1~~TRINITY_DN15730_c0_g1_i1.p1  ORF type:complete len:373 (-),score=146.54 TRINITY_DN15730_c0_g1_i1:90-1208(-)